MKYFKIGLYEISAIAIFILAAILRIAFVSLGGPLTNSDEGTIGIMALHVAYRGAHPIFYYGQNYMGSFEAFVAAVFFHLFGPSLLSLRLSLVLLFVLFLACMYLLTRLLYTRGWALVVLVLLGSGSSYVLARELSAIGGYPETLLFGALSCLLASWLALSYDPALPLRKRSWRFALYALWGLIVGLGLWSDLLIAPFVVMPGLLLLVVCWRELLRIVATVCILLGLGIGAYPLIRYNLRAAPGQDSLTILRGLRGSSNTYLTLANLLKEVKSTLQVSIPSMTGNPFCPVTELPFLGPNSPRSLPCTLVHGIWGVGYMLVFVIALVLVLRAIWNAWHRLRAAEKDAQFSDTRRDLVRQAARLMLLGCAILTLFAYTFSEAPIQWPGIHARYIIGLLICTPAILWPLWRGLGSVKNSLPALTALRKIVCSVALVALCVVLLTGTVLAFTELPSIQAKNARDMALVRDLVRLKVTHVYTDYWTCNKIAFVSNEQVTCGVVSGQLQPSHNRVPGYYTTVSADPRAAYAFPADSGYVSPAGSNVVPAVEQKLRQTNYRRLVLDGYVIYLPE